MAVGAAIASAAAGVAGSLFNSIYSIYRNKQLDAREDNAIQRRVADLQAAGLNPLLAAGQGAGASAGLSTNLDTSGFGNVAQSMFDLKNQRESYKQNQLYTKLMENELSEQNFNRYLNQTFAYNTYGIGGYLKPKYDKLGNLINDSGNKMHFKENSDRLNNYFNFLNNESDYNFNQSMFNLKTQNYMNGLELSKETLSPLLDLAGILNPISAARRAFGGQQNYNYNNSNLNYRGYTQNYNYNYRRR